MVILLFFAALFPFAAQAQENPELALYRARVLALRVENVLRYRKNAIESCSPKISNDLSLVFSALVRNPISSVTPDASVEGILLRDLDLYGQTQSPEVVRHCGAALGREEKKLFKLERKKFFPAAVLAELSCASIPVPACKDLVPKIYRELDPHCALAEEVMFDFKGKDLEINPCFAGDKLVSQSLWSGQGSSKDRIRSFVLKMHEAISGAAEGSSLELGTLSSLSDCPPQAAVGVPAAASLVPSPEQILAILAFLAASSSSSSGYVDGFGDHLWRTGLALGYSPQATLDGYHFYKRLKDLGRDLFAWARRKKMKVLLAGFDMSQSNRHDYMAAFLSCHYRNEDHAILARVLPLLLGYAYESLDFVSHFKQGVDPLKSIKNFQEDTNRYRRAAKIGFSFCDASR